MNHYTAIEYLAIDIANAFGMDKTPFEYRIQWVRASIDRLESMTEQADEPHLYFKAVNAFRKALKGLPIGHTVALDAVCSGLQIMSVLTGCKSGCALTGLIDPNARTDAYTLITQYMNEQLKNPVSIERKQAKEAVMTALYGSEEIPKEIFGDKTPAYRTFHKVLGEKAFGAYWLLQELKKAWNPNAYAHAWVLPDGYQAYVPVMALKETRVSVAELDYTMSVQYYENEPEEKGISLPANVTHSVDAYVLRSLIRRCNYSPKQVNKVLIISKNELQERGDNLPEELQDESLIKYVGLYLANTMIDVVIINHINETNIKQVPTYVLNSLNKILDEMLKHEPFEVIPVHDSFACHPNHCNQLRYWYKEILAELADSTVLASIFTQLSGEETTYTKIDSTLSQHIRESNYGIC